MVQTQNLLHAFFFALLRRRRDSILLLLAICDLLFIHTAITSIHIDSVVFCAYLLLPEPFALVCIWNFKKFIYAELSLDTVWQCRSCEQESLFPIGWKYEMNNNWMRRKRKKKVKWNKTGNNGICDGMTDEWIESLLLDKN